MAVHRSTEKRLRKSKVERLQNRILKTRIKTATKKVLSAPDKESALKAVREAASILDKAAQKGAIHRNLAARRKSKLMKKASGIGEG